MHGFGLEVAAAGIEQGSSAVFRRLVAPGEEATRGATAAGCHPAGHRQTT